MYQLHVKGTKTLIEASENRIGRWVQLSSVGVYGARRIGIITEESPIDPKGIYEQTKSESDNLVREAGINGVFETVIVQPSNVFGPTMTNRSLFQLISNIHLGRFCFIGKQKSMVNYIHVENVVAGLMLCAGNEKVNGKVYILSTSMSLREFVGKVCAVTDRPHPRCRVPEFIARLVAKTLGKIKRFPLTSARVDALTNQVTFSGQKIKDDLGFQEVLTLQDGIKEVSNRVLNDSSKN